MPALALIESVSQWRWLLRWIAVMSTAMGVLLVFTPATISPTFEHLVGWRVWPEVAGAILLAAGLVQWFAVVTDRARLLTWSSIVKLAWYGLVAAVFAWQFIDWSLNPGSPNPPAVYPVPLYMQLAGIELLQVLGSRKLRKTGSRLP